MATQQDTFSLAFRHPKALEKIGQKLNWAAQGGTGSTAMSTGGKRLLHDAGRWGSNGESQSCTHPQSGDGGGGGRQQGAVHHQ